MKNAKNVTTMMNNRNSFRATAPPFLDYLRGVLRRYPDGGQILKELVQNADDAGATEVVFISDERTFDVESLWSDKMGRYQGPALFAFNNAVFTDEDWQGIQSSGRSVKRDNPNKVGRFGIGFNSVYHLTDLPCIFSAKNLAMFDPQKSVFENEGFMWNLDFEEDRAIFLNLHNQFQPFKEVLNHVCDYSWEDIISRDQHFNGTLFRFPLRSEPSAIADNKYDSAKISQLFSSFIKDVDLCLLFLRNVNKVLLLHIDPEGSASIRLNVTASNRKLCSASLKRDLKVEGSTCLRSINSLCPDNEETKTQWVVTETHIKQGKAPELDSLSKRLSLHPEVSLAFPVEGERVLTSGRLSCFLPLPNNEQNTTGLPLHVHASFGLTDNRRDVKWQEEDQKYDEVALWNELILKEVLPSAYILLILDVVDLCSYSRCFPASTVYHIWPDLASLEHKKRWQMIALDTARHLLHLDVLCLAEDETQWVKPTEAVFPPDDNTDPFIKQAVSDYLISSGVKLVYTPPSVRRSIEEAARVQCKTITKATGEYVRNIIRTAIPADSSKEMRLALLEYVLDDRKYSELEELQLLPLSDGSFTAFSKQIEKVVFMDSDEFPRELLPCIEKRFILKDLKANIHQHLLETEQTRLFKISSLNQPIVEQLCASSLPKDWQKSRDHVTWEIGNSLHPSARWLREFWRFLNTHVKDLKNYVGLPLIPLDVIYDHTQVVQLARLEENTTLMFGVSQHGCLSEELISLLERVGATIIIRKDECLRHENLVNYILTPSPRNVMQILLNLEIAEVIDGVNSAPSREKESLKTFLASLDSFSENESNLLSKLHLFRSLPNIKGDGSNYLPADSLPAIDLSPIPAIPSHLLMPDVILKCETEADRRLLSLLNVKLLKSPQVANLLVLGIEQAVYGKEDVNNIMDWILESGSVLFALENSLSRTCVNLCFMEIHGGKKAKASDLFDPNNETFQALLQDDFFPPFPFRNEQILESLRRLGMKTKVEDLEPLDILHIATDISSSYKNSPEGAFAKAKELIKLCNRASVLTKFSDSQMDNFLNTQWFPCDNVCTDPTAAQCTIFCEPKDIRDSSYINLVGLVMPLTNRVHGEARERLGLMRRPPAIKVFENLSALRMISQASQDSNADTKFKENLHSIYRFLQDEMKFDVTIKTLIKQYKDTPLLWVRDDFLIPSNVVFGYPQGLDLSSCIPQVPEEFLQYKKLLKEFGVKEGLTDNEIVGLLYTIKNKIDLREPPCGTCIEREVVINILNWMCREKKTAQDDLPVPVMTENCAFNLQRKCSAVFCDITSDSMAELQDENGKVYIVLEEVPKATAVELKIPLLSTQILKPEHIRFEQCGQTEPITRRIRNILEEYDDENDLFKELIQNAEDAGAKTCRFMLDYRENQELNGLIDPGMALCQGPCLWAFNDETFTEEDWINIVKVGARSKEQKVEKIGQFGLGFNAVYHVTDIPSVLSNRKLLILDPNVTHLPKHIQSRANPGIKIDFGRERVLSSFPGQFRSYEGIFNWKSGQLPYVGTLIKLPFRTENEAKMSEISKKFYTENSIVAFENHLSQNSDTLLLFLKNIKEVTLQILSKNSSFPPKNDQIQSPLRISKKQLRIIEIPEDMRKVQISTMQSLMSLNHKCGNIIECHSANLFEITVENKGSCSIQHWLQYSCFGLEKANEVVKNQSHQDFSLPVGGVAIPLRYDQTLGCCVPHSVNTAGGVYCFLPLSVHSGLPVHINGTFSVTSNRKTLWDTGSKHKWNEDLLRESVTTAYITALLVLKDMAQDESLQTYLYFEFWPDIQKVSKAFQTLASAFYSAVIQGFHGRSLELFSDGTNWCSMDNARFLHPNIEKNEHIGQIAKDMFQKTRNKTFLAVPLPEWVRNGFIQTGHKDTVENNTFHWLELYKEVIFPNLADMDLKSRDILILHAIDVNDEQIDTLLKKHPCIPTHKGLWHINELVNPYGKAACLYEPHEGRILEGTENDFLSPKRVRRLIELGLMNDQLPFHEIIERAKKIKDIWMYDKRKADQKYKCILDMSSNLLQENFRRFPSLQKFHNSVSPDWTLLGNVAFIPARLLFKQGLEHDDEIVLKRPNEIYKYKSRHLVGMTQYFVEDNNISSLHGVVLQKLGVAEEPSPQVVCRQLCKSLEYSKGKPEGTVTAILFENANQCYKYLEESLARNKGNLKLREMAQQFPLVFIDNIFVDAEKVAKTVKFDARPYLYKLPNEFTGFKHLWNCIGVKEHFTQKDYLEVLQNLKERYQNNPLSPSDLDICLQIVTKGLYRQHEFKQGDCLLPDENCVLRNSSQLYYNDTKWLPSPDDLLLCHEYIPRSIAVNLKVPTTRDLTLQEHLIDEQFFNFEQKEKLTVRLKNIISAYPSKRDILKELIQNADDAQATEIHFIWDPRHHKTEKTCGDHWNYLQGPALCVYNNKVFSETDLDGIQQIGEGGKHGTIGTTGKFGLGFNSVYHLTDCPSLLTGDEKLCISDPNKFVLKETGKVGEGYKVTQKFKDSFPDVYNTYLPSFFHLDCGTMFRLPVRTQEMAQRSEISREHVTIKDIQQLCASLVEDPDSLVLFLRHIKKIAFHQISENELKPVFTTEIHMSDECSTKKHDIQTCLHSGKDNGGSGVPFQTIYRMDIQSKGKDTSHWIVAEKVGSKGTKYDSRLPQVGVAACLGKEISGRAFCSLPLPGNTGLPVHINGNFEVDSSRRCLWKEDGMSNKVKWNEFLMQDFIAPLYGDLLDYIRTHCLCSPEEYPSLHELSKHIESGYLAFFPHVSDNTVQEWKEMVLRLYRHIKERQLMLIPVFQIHNPVNAQSKAKSFTLTWSTICGAKLTDAPHLVSNFKECFLEVLDSVGMNLVPLSDSTAKLWSNFKEAGIQVQSVSPPKVREYLKVKTLNDPQKTEQDLPLPIVHTLIKNKEKCKMLLNYCLQDINENNYSSIEGLPLLLTCDLCLRYFRTSEPKLFTKFPQLFENIGNYIADYSLNYRHLNILEKGHFLRDMKISISAGWLKSTLQQFLQDCQTDPKSSLHIANENINIWLKTFWQYIEDQISSSDPSHDGRTDMFCEIKSLFCHSQIILVKLPSQNKTWLLPLNKLSSVVSSAHGEISEILIKLGFMTLDRTIFSLNMLSLYIMPELMNVQNHLAVLEQLYKLHPPFEQIQKHDIDKLLFFLLSGLHTSENPERYAGKLRSLPLYETMEGTLQNLSRCSKVIVFQTNLIDQFPTFPRGDVDIVILKYNKLNLIVSTQLKAEVVNDVGFFVKFIMPTIDNFSEPQVLSAIKALLAIQQHKDYNKYRPHILSKFRQLRFIKDMHGNFQIPSYFYDEEQDFFKIMLPDERFIPNSFWSSIHCAKNRLKKLLVDLGLKKNVSSQDCIEFALQIQRSIAGKTSTEILKRRAKAVLDWILNRKQNEFDEDFFDQISDIKFVFPQKIPEPLCNLHQPFAAEGVTVSIRGSLIENNRFDKELIWTSMPVLPLQCTTKSVCDILSACGAVNGPPTECIFKNLRNICHAPCLTPDLVKTRSSVLHSSYAFLQSADYNVSSLSDLPLVLVEKGTVLVKPSNTVLSLTDDTDFRPYLYSLPFKLIIYKEFFKKVGVEETPSVKHYSKVLNDVHEDSSNKQTLNANQMKTVRRAVQKLLRMLEKHPEQRAGLHIPLYLPAVDGRLYNSQSLYFNDTVFQPKRWEESINATLQLLEKLNMCYLGNDSYEHKKLVQSLPEKIRPKMLSQLVREDLQKSSMITCEYGEFCEFRENFHRHLSASYFMHGIIAVIRHQYKGAVSQDQAISICKKIFTSIKIICCKTLDTVLVLDGKPLENSTEENPIYVDRDNESCTFFLKHSDDLSLKTMNEINLRIATMINVLFQKCLNSDSVLIIAQLLCCDNLDDVQRVLEKNGIYDSTTGEAEYDKLPVPGSIIPEEWIDSLDMYFLHNFEKGEYVGVKMPPDDNEVYYYAKIIDRVNALSDQQGPATSRYRVQIGPDKEIQAGSLDIYKFIRTGTSSDHSARSCKNLVFIGHLAQVQHPQTADRVQQLSLEEIKKDIDRCLREIWTLPEEERHKAVRRLYLKWHPDKNPNCAELATEAFKYVQKRIQELEEGKMKCRSGVYQEAQQSTGDCHWSCGNQAPPGPSTGFRGASNKDYPKQTRNYRKFYQQWNQQASSHRRGRERFQEQHSSEGYDFWKFHGHSTPKPDQRALEAQRWLKQAKRDLDGANNDFGRGFTEWCLFKIHQAVEKCLVSVEYKRNGQLPANRTISSLAQKVAGYSPKLSSVPNMVNRLQKLGVDAKRTQYPNYHPLPCIPNEQFPSENEPQAMSLASELLAQVNEYITD